jgi:hypothetical protein
MNFIQCRGQKWRSYTSTPTSMAWCLTNQAYRNLYLNFEIKNSSKYSWCHGRSRISGQSISCFYFLRKYGLTVAVNRTSHCVTNTVRLIGWLYSVSYSNQDFTASSSQAFTLAIYRQQKVLSHFPVCCWIDWLLMIKNCLIESGPPCR